LFIHEQQNIFSTFLFRVLLHPNTYQTCAFCGTHTL
jgi:hypothetical protein